MSNGIGKLRIISRLQPGNDAQWSIIAELAHMEEPELQRLLRPHSEMRFNTDQQGIADNERRRRLDVALGALTMLEVAYQVDVADPPTEGAPEAESLKVPEANNLKILFESEAFLRYVNAYLYFGIRFLSWRMSKPEWYTVDSKILFRDSNEQTLGLCTPPDLEGYAIADATIATLVDSSASCDPAINSANPGPEAQALKFLDGFTRDQAEQLDDRPKETDRFELWLRGLSPGSNEQDRFRVLSHGLREWAINRANFYHSLQSAAVDPALPLSAPPATRPIGGWVVTNPLASRFALADVYWISRLLRADVAADANVTYTRRNWLQLLRFRILLDGAADVAQQLEALTKAEEMLRSVFDFVCDLVKNAVEITQEEEKRKFEPELFPPLPPTTAKWRKVFDEELDEIEQQRKRRDFKEASQNGGVTGDGGGGGGTVHNAAEDGDDWMERIRRNKPTRNLIGLSFSGGGIRSATFNLGVLQGLQELDLLRKIDFISTVSGGGFIGSWLVANVYRTRHWLGRLMNWEESINHLRRYSNYLAPRLGVFTADTWSMWVSWARNAFLIQISGLAWLWTALLVALLGQFAFVEGNEDSDWYRGLAEYLSGHWPGTFALFSSSLHWLRHVFHHFSKTAAFVTAASLIGLVLVILLYNLSGDRAVKDRPSEKKDGVFKRRSRPSSAEIVWSFAIIPAWCASFLFASILWAEARSNSLGTDFGRIRNVYRYSRVLQWILYAWPVLIWIALFLIAFLTLSRLRHKHLLRREGAERVGWRIWHAGWIGLFCVFVLLLELAGILSLFNSWSNVWYAYIVGPPLVLAAHTISVVFFIGFCGRHSKEAIREWWTRFGAGLAMFGAAYFALTIAAVFGPYWILYLFGLGVAKWASVIGWLATVVAGLFAGKSSKTAGNGVPNKSSWLQALAKVGGFVFIVGAVLFASTALYIVLAKIGARAWNWHGYWETLPHIGPATIIVALFVSLICGALFSRFFEINIFGLNQFYRFRLVRCYLGATRWAPGFRKPQPFTNFDGEDDIKLADLFKEGFRGPFPIYNCALNLSGSADLALHTRHSASFSLTPLRCGADRRRVGYARTEKFADGVMLGQAVAISGAAASPNMGFNTSALVAFLLTMFNVRLGWWFPNPGQKLWDRPGLSFSLYYLLLELFGVADEKSRFVNVSDGGHFENLGVYELVRRRCKVIIVCDAECDESLQFGSLGNLVRMCETDFGAKIEIDVNSIRQQKDRFSFTHCSIGKITYSNGSLGHMIYLKASMSGDEDVGIAQYRSVHPSFPHETTADQFFSEDQFESYRRLGLHIVRMSLRGSEPGDDPVTIAEKLADVLAPSGCSSEAFLKHTKILDRIWERFRADTDLHPFFEELMRQTAPVYPPGPAAPVRDEETIVGLELIQLMENVFLDLRLDDFWSHPDNRGWAILFMRWARSPRFREIWKKTRRTFGIRFEYFCEARLGLERDNPIVRV
jgi:hypothetical protein